MALEIPHRGLRLCEEALEGIDVALIELKEVGEKVLGRLLLGGSSHGSLVV